MNYNKELKDIMIKRMFPPNNESIAKISHEEGNSEQTLRNWKDNDLKNSYATPGKTQLQMSGVHRINFWLL